MEDGNRFVSGVITGMLLAVVGDGLHWFITPMDHLHASAVDHDLVAAQVFIAAAVALWLIARARTRKPAAPAL